VGNSYLGVRLDALRASQNPDGGWGYFPGKQSWLEPTAYATLALHGDPAADRAWALLKRWQARDGGWRPAADVAISSWGTALCVTIATVRGESGDALGKGMEWLLGSQGVESNFKNRAAMRVGLFQPGRNITLRAWPWKSGTASWVEPTAHSLVALKRVAVKTPSPEIAERVRQGEAQLMDVRCSDGGWNYGSASALGDELISYPETTALALLGLQGRAEVRSSLTGAGRIAAETPSPLARAWTAIALRLHGVEPPTPEGGPIPDLLVTAIEALAAPEGHYTFFATGDSR
jgi:hypothetical protein